MLKKFMKINENGENIFEIIMKNIWKYELVYEISFQDK
jgi:hypothetical protein